MAVGLSTQSRHHDQEYASRKSASCWDRYAENQDLVNKNSSVMKQQAAMIAALEQRLDRQGKAPEGKGAKGDKKRIRELEADVESLKVCALLQCWMRSTRRGIW